MRQAAKKSLYNVGSAASPLDLKGGILGYRQQGKWHYQSPETKHRFGEAFIEVTNPELILELMSWAHHVIYPAHQCVDRPNLPCPACDQEGLRALGINPKLAKLVKRPRH